jgi:hypothetical protein
MNAWARQQWECAIELDPNLTKPKRDVWSNRPKSEADTQKVIEEYEKRISGPSSRDVGSLYAELGQWAQSQGLEPAALSCYRLAVEYEGANNRIRNFLGHVNVGQEWLCAGQKRVSECFRPPQLSSGSPFEGNTNIDETLKTKFKKQSGERVWILSTFLSDGHMAAACRAGHHVWLSFPKIFGPLPNNTPTTHIFVIEKEIYLDYVDKLALTTSETQRKRLKESRSGYYGDPVSCFVKWKEIPSDRIEDTVIHATVHDFMHRFGVDRSWFYEGTGFLFSLNIHGNVYSYCSGWTSSAGRDVDETLNWKSFMKFLVRARIDPPAAAVLRAQTDDLSTEKSVKAWSYVDYITSEHPDNALNLLLALRSSKSEDAIQKVFGMTAEQFDAAWRAWVASTY